ncbi:MAG TPA: 50S ribosomal protein L22 [Verrucomicrobiae bacterium]|nr:50S ribosomal protein L22 [Verrucomicrobiae bacterium]
MSPSTTSLPAQKDAEQRTNAVAHLKFARMGPRKLRRVADAIRGKSVREALMLLKFADVYASKPLEKLVKSAVANAGNNHSMNGDDLFIVRITVDGGPGGRFTKRLDPRAQGRAYFKRKRMSHVTVVVSEQPLAKKPRMRGGASISLTRQPVRRTTATAAPAAAAKAGSSKSGAAKKPATRKRTPAKKAGE